MTRGALLAAGVAVVSLALATPLVQAWLVRSDGAALYHGRQPLAARVAGHADALPPHAARCANCHEGTQALGPRLAADTLARDLPRRGGPPSRYDEGALCRLLRDGVDPAFVMVPRAMPRYELDSAACAALWSYLASR